MNAAMATNEDGMYYNDLSSPTKLTQTQVQLTS